MNYNSRLLSYRYKELPYSLYLELAKPELFEEADLEPLKIAVLRSCTLEPVEPVLRVELAFEGWNAECQFMGFNSFEQELLNPQGPLSQGKYDILLFFLTAQEVCPELLFNFQHLSWEAVEQTLENIKERVRLFMESARKQQNSRVIVSAIDMPRRGYFGILDASLERSQQEVFDRLNRKIGEVVRSHADAFVLDVPLVAGMIGRETFYDWGMYYRSSMPFSREGLVALAREIKRVVFGAYGKTKKCMVADLDNTLWGGIVGEDGVGHILTGPADKGKPYYDFQRALKEISSKGIVLAIASKNNEVDAKEAFEKRAYDMAISLKDFVLTKISWNSKVQSIQEIAEELDIGLDSLVFLDDNPVEREMVRSQLPEVYTPELPESASEYAYFMSDLYVFEKNIFSKEDQKKVQMYREQGKRAALKHELDSLEDFWKALEMNLLIVINDKANVPRLSQLTQKTNQFNVTTRRYSESEMSAFFESPNAAVFSWSVVDKFGDNGIVGLMIVKLQGEEAELDVLLQSCRVIGRTVEKAVFASVVSYLAKEKGIRRIKGEYIPTKKNALVNDLYKKLGFQEESEYHYVYDLQKDLPQPPSWFNSIEMNAWTRKD